MGSDLPLLPYLYLLFATAFVVAAIAVWLMKSHSMLQVALKPIS